VTPQIVPDTQHRGLVARLPATLRGYAQLARFDRPIGWWLLFWPAAWSVLLAGGGERWSLIAWLLLGAIAMRGAGCVYNDIVDRDLDRQVARTAVRPVASGAVSLRAASGDGLRQRLLLEREGVRFDARGRVLERHRWIPRPRAVTGR